MKHIANAEKLASRAISYGESSNFGQCMFMIIVVSFDFASQWIMSDFSYGSPSKWLGRPARTGRLMNVLVENKARSFWFWKQRQRLPVKHKLTFTKCSPYRLFLSESLRKSRRGPWNANVSTHKIVGLNRRRCFLFTAHAYTPQNLLNSRQQNAVLGEFTKILKNNVHSQLWILLSHVHVLKLY